MKIFLVLITSSIVLASHIPETSEEKNLNPNLIARFFKDISPEHTLVSKIEYRKDNDRNVGIGEVSLRRNISRFVQYGLETDVSKGLRHDEDWDLVNGKWKWRDGELEFSSALFLKLKRDFYIGEKTFTASVNIKTQNNWTKTLLTLKPEFVLTYHHFNEGIHKFNIYIKSTYYIPFNYSDEDIYASWYYVGFMHNYSKKIKPFIFYAIKEQTWTATDKYKEEQLEEYKSKSTLSYVGLGLNYYF